MTPLQQTVLAITKALNHSPDRTPHMAWRLHTDDLWDVMQEAKKFEREFGMKKPEGWRPVRDFELLGVRVFGDDSAPRLERPA